VKALFKAALTLTLKIMMASQIIEIYSSMAQVLHSSGPSSLRGQATRMKMQLSLNFISLASISVTTLLTLMIEFG
jgi:hypothetical protein